MDAAQTWNERHMDLVVHSPHLDDGIFSCGGRIAETTARGSDALIVTLCTREPNLAEVPPSLHKFCDYSVRKAEDTRAAEVLGAKVQWLNFVERGFRSPALSGWTAVFRTPKPGHETFDNLDAIQRTIIELLADFPDAEVLAPLAVGNHIDHVELFVAAVNVLMSRRDFNRLRFYEDAYTLGARARKQHFVTRQRRWSRREAPERQSLRARAMFTALGLARRGPPVELLLPPDAPSLGGRYEVRSIAKFEEQKLAAVVDNISQISMFGGATAWCDLLRSYHRCWGVGEPIWHAVPVAA